MAKKKVTAFKTAECKDAQYGKKSSKLQFLFLLMSILGWQVCM